MKKLLLLTACAFIFSCQNSKETPTSGRLRILVEESLSQIVQKQMEQFQRLYPKTQISDSIVTAREAVIELLAGKARVMFLTRQLVADEEAAFTELKLNIHKNKIASDGIAIIVQSGNPVEKLTLVEVKKIFTGEIKNWKTVGGRNHSIDIIARDRNSGIGDFIWTSVLNQSHYADELFEVKSSSQMIDAVRQNENAVGFVGLNWVKMENGVKALKVAETDTSHYVVPHPGTIYNQTYPLRMDVYSYMIEEQTIGVGAGFLAFVMSNPGQKVFVDGGLAPATIPVRLVEFGKGDGQ